MRYQIPVEQLREMPTEEVIARAQTADWGAVHTLCYRYVTGTSNTPVDYEKGYFWCRRGAMMGNSTSQYVLARIYERGLGRPRDMAQALNWVHEAARRDFAPAQFQLYERYARGLGVRQDADASRAWLSQAVSQRYPPALEEQERLDAERKAAR